MEGNENWLAACRVKDQLQPEESWQDLQRRVRVIESFPFNCWPTNTHNTYQIIPGTGPAYLFNLKNETWMLLAQPQRPAYALHVWWWVVSCEARNRGSGEVLRAKSTFFAMLAVEQNERGQSLVWVSTPQRGNLVFVFCFPIP